MAEVEENERIPFIVINIDKDFTIKTIGFILIFIGLFLGIINKYFCNSLCETCGNSELLPCFLLLIFAGITFIINGAIMIILRIGKDHKENWSFGKL